MSVRQLRLVVTVENHAEALRFFRDVLGMSQVDDFSSDEGRCILLDAGRATVEVIDERQAHYIDRVEVGRRVAGSIRVGLEVDDTAGLTARLVDTGATVLADPVRTPWESVNARVVTPDGVQLTLFEEPR